MGGFSVFEVAPEHPDVWAAVMCIAGSFLGSDSERVIARMPRTPFYILTGSADETIPTQYPTSTAAFLSAAGFDVSFYSQLGGVVIAFEPDADPDAVVERHAARHHARAAALLWQARVTRRDFVERPASLRLG